MSLKNELSHDEMPYEKCREFGPEMLTDAELLAVFIRTGSKELSCISVARKLIGENKDGKGLFRLLDLSLPELKKMYGIGEVKAIQLLCIMEISKRLWRMKRISDFVFTVPSDIADYFMEELRHLKTETTRVLYLNTKGALIKDMELTTGTVNSSLLSPREYYINALKYKAVNTVLVHNHPSGDPTPSNSDIELTRSIFRAGELLGIKLIDHIIIGDNRFMSFREAGLIP